MVFLLSIRGGKQFRNYGVNDGLPGLDLTGWGAGATGPSGEMFFGGFSGSTVFDPNRTTASQEVPKIKLTDFRLFGAEVKLGPTSALKESITTSSSITLSHWQNFFTLEFAALSFGDASANRYRYLLENLDRGWIETDSQTRFANYTGVPPGTYRFRVQGATGRSGWSAPGAVLRITILAPWWNTWWFRLAGLALGAIAIFLIHHQRVRQTTDRLNLRFQGRLAERTRIARDLHDTLLQSFHGLMLRFQAVHNLLPDRPLEAQRSLGIAIDRAADAITESRDAVYKLRNSKASRDDLIGTLTSLGQDLAADQAGENGNPITRFRVIVEGVPRKLHPLLRDDVITSRGKPSPTRSAMRMRARSNWT